LGRTRSNPFRVQFSGLDFGQDGLGALEEGLLDALAGPGARLQEDEVVLLRESAETKTFLSFFLTYFFTGCPGRGANFGSLNFRLFSHHSTAVKERKIAKNCNHNRK
jgi:hypothetical protein